MSITRGDTVTGTWHKAVRSSWFTWSASVLLGAAVWELVGRLGPHDKLVFVPLSTVLRSLGTWFSKDHALSDLRTSAVEFGIGYGIALGVGLVVGVILGRSKFLNKVFGPIIYVFYTAPIITLSPVIIGIIGLNLGAESFIIFAIAVFPVIFNTIAGIRNVPKDLKDVATAYDGPRLRRLLRVEGPGALIHIMVGARMAVSRALVGLYLAELLGASDGVGFTAYTAYTNLDVPRLYAALLALALAGMVITGLLRLIEVRITHGVEL
ncbi:MAG TPA: ABC transporter permease subunit [Pseudonocardiaceae bacterium]|nr:ABC transporter permease subunit [Pseudonocardiaceae bacterium]